MSLFFNLFKWQSQNYWIALVAYWPPVVKDLSSTDRNAPMTPKDKVRLWNRLLKCYNFSVAITFTTNLSIANRARQVQTRPGDWWESREKSLTFTSARGKKGGKCFFFSSGWFRLCSIKPYLWFYGLHISFWTPTEQHTKQWAVTQGTAAGINTEACVGLPSYFK